MDNHYHLLLETPSGNLPQIMRHVNGAYTTYYNVKRARSGHLFQGRYKAILVEIDEYAKELSRYIHLNPVRANMVDKPEDYVWSSYQFYIGRKKPPKWLHRDFILRYFGNKVNLAQKGYHRFVSTLTDQNYESPLNDVTSSTLLGSPGFITFIRDNFLADKPLDKNLPALRELLKRPSIPAIIDSVKTAFIGPPRLRRSVTIYLCQQHTGLKLEDIGKQFGIGESGVSQASRRIAEKMKSDKKFQKMVLQIEKKL